MSGRPANSSGGAVGKAGATIFRRWKRDCALLPTACVIAGLAAGLSPTSIAAQPLPRTVLYLDQGPSNNPAARAISGAFQAKMNAESGNSVFVYPENLAIPIFGNARYPELLHDHFREKYRGKPIGVIVSRGTATLSYALRLRDALWPGTALVFTSVGDATVAELPLNVTGVTYGLRLQSMLDVARLLAPNLRRVAIVGDRLDSENTIRRYARDLPGIAAQIEVINWTNLPLAEIKERVATLPDDAAILYVNLTTDGAGASFISRDVLPSIAKVANRPIVVDTEAAIGFGGTGGLVNTYEGAGEKAAQFALRILNGESASSIPISRGETIKWIFDWRELQRWGVREDRLPAGSDIRFRTPTAWERYQWQISLTAAALLGQSLLITWLLYERRRRRQAEVATRQRAAELARMNRRAVAGEMSASIAHEVNQPLTAILSNAEALHDLLGQERLDVDKIREIVADIIDEDTRASEVIDRIRKFLRKDDSKSEMVDLNQLVVSTLRLVHGELVKRKTSVETALAVNLPAIAGDPVQLQQVLLNLVMNAMDALDSKSPSGRKIKISTRGNGKHVEADITDFGHGIAAGNQRRLLEPFFTTKEHGLGLGLSICSTIVKAHGGELSIDNNDHGGATVVLSFLSAKPALVRA